MWTVTKLANKKQNKVSTRILAKQKFETYNFQFPPPPNSTCFVNVTLFFQVN